MNKFEQVYMVGGGGPMSLGRRGWVPRVVRKGVSHF